MKHTITVLTSDMRELNYGNSDSCPITKALQRAGFTDWKDEGIDIVDKDRKTVYRYSKENIEKFVFKMLGMMNSVGGRYIDGEEIIAPVPIEDIEFTFEI